MSQQAIGPPGHLVSHTCTDGDRWSGAGARRWSTTRAGRLRLVPSLPAAATAATVLHTSSMDEAGDAIADQLTQPRNSNFAVFDGAHPALDGPQLSTHTGLSSDHYTGQSHVHVESHVEFDDETCIGMEVSELSQGQPALWLGHYEMDVAATTDDDGYRSSSNFYDEDSGHDTDESDENEFAYVTVEVGRPLSACGSESTNARHSTSTPDLTSQCTIASD